VIFHDATLRAIAEMEPRDLDEPTSVARIAGSKLQRYGEALLQLFVD